MLFFSIPVKERVNWPSLVFTYCWVVLALAPWLWWWLTPGAFLTPGALHTSCVYSAGKGKAVVCCALFSLCLQPGLYSLSCVSAVQQPEVTVSVGWLVWGDSVSPSRCDTSPLEGLAVVCSLRALWNQKSWNRWDSEICFMEVVAVVGEVTPACCPPPLSSRKYLLSSLPRTCTVTQWISTRDLLWVNSAPGNQTLFVVRWHLFFLERDQG